MTILDVITRPLKLADDAAAHIRAGFNVLILAEGLAGASVLDEAAGMLARDHRVIRVRPGAGLRLSAGPSAMRSTAPIGASV